MLPWSFACVGLLAVSLASLSCSSGPGGCDTGCNRLDMDTTRPALVDGASFAHGTTILPDASPAVCGGRLAYGPGFDQGTEEGRSTPTVGHVLLAITCAGPDREPYGDLSIDIGVPTTLASGPAVISFSGEFGYPTSAGSSGDTTPPCRSTADGTGTTVDVSEVRGGGPAPYPIVVTPDFHRTVTVTLDSRAKPEGCRESFRITGTFVFELDASTFQVTPGASCECGI